MVKNELLMLTSFPPRKCGIATYSQDLINALEEKFENNCSVRVCALTKDNVKQAYPPRVKYIINSHEKDDFRLLATKINSDSAIRLIYVQHEFGLYGGVFGDYLLHLLSAIRKPVITTFHTVLPAPCEERKKVIQRIAALSADVTVMTKHSANILSRDYDIDINQIAVIPHGTHLLKPLRGISDKSALFPGRKVLATFGLISKGKGIETAIEALPAIVSHLPDVIYLVIGRTHPEVLKQEGEKYREYLQEKVRALKLHRHVLFINEYLSLDKLLAYLQRTDLYLFTSRDPHQAVSGTLAYALSAGCPVVFTPIPHALELAEGAGLSFDFQNPEQLGAATMKLLCDPDLMHEMRLNALHRMSPTAWQNVAILIMELLEKRNSSKTMPAKLKAPPVSLAHLKRMTLNRGIIQFAVFTQPDRSSGYTLDDNARALIVATKYYNLVPEYGNTRLIRTYLRFILFCQQADGSFLNYADINGRFPEKNGNENLEDANGRAIWALGEFLSMSATLPPALAEKAQQAFIKALPGIGKLQSPRAIAFAIKGLYYYEQFRADRQIKGLIIKLADNLVSKYRGVSNITWRWFEDYLTYANSVLPEALLLAAKSTRSALFRNIAVKSMDFLLSVIFKNDRIKVVSNKGWYFKGQDHHHFGEQPVEIAYTILALDTFFGHFNERHYLDKMKTAFNWFMGDNHIRHIIYNPATGGCYDGLEEKHINLNQGAESTVSYLMARLTMEKHLRPVIVKRVIVTIPGMRNGSWINNTVQGIENSQFV